MKHIKMEIQKNGNRWRVILDGKDAQPQEPTQPTPYEQLKASLGLTGERSKIKSHRMEFFASADDERTQYESTAHEAVETAFTSFYNQGIATNLEWVNQDKSKGWFWVSGKTALDCQRNLVGALTQIMINKILTDAGGVAFKGKTNGVMPIAREMALEIYKGMESCPDFVDYKNATLADPLNLDCYSMGTIKAESPSE